MDQLSPMTRRRLLTFAGIRALGLLLPGVNALAAPVESAPVVWHSERWRTLKFTFSSTTIVDGVVHQNVPDFLVGHPWYRPSEEECAKLFETQAGRDELANEMLVPIQSAIDRHSLLRTLLTPDGNKLSTLICCPKRGDALQEWSILSGLPLPIEKVASRATINLNEIRRQRWYIVDRAQRRSAESILRLEDIEFLFLANHIRSRNGQELIHIADATFLPQHLEALVGRIGSRIQGKEAHVVVGVRRAHEIKTWWEEGFRIRSAASRIVIHVSSACDEDAVWAVGEPTQNGVWLHRQSSTVSHDDPRRLRLGWLTEVHSTYGARPDMPVASLNFSGSQAERHYTRDGTVIS